MSLRDILHKRHTIAGLRNKYLPWFSGPRRALNHDPDLSRRLYIDLMKKCLTDSIYWDAREGPYLRPDLFPDGTGWRRYAHTMVKMARLDNLQYCVERVISDKIPGDLIETGVWRGGASILMRAILKAHDIRDQAVWLADSFQGMPASDPGYPADADMTFHTIPELSVPLEQVKANFAKYDLLDDQVRFLKGWFSDTLASAPIEQLSVIRLDGTMYGSTMDALTALYPKLQDGGFLIVDDYGAFPACRQAVHDYRDAHGVVDPIQTIDGAGVYWRRGRGPNTSDLR